MASAICRISVSLMLQPKVFQLFQPIGGVRATPFSSACAAGAEATLRAPEISNSPATSAVFRRLTGYRLVHCWFAAAVQVHRTTWVPLAVALPLTSRQRPDWALLIVPLEFRFHRWLAPPWQSHSCALAPAVALVGESRHLPRDCRVWPLRVQRWLAAPLQS